MNELEGLGLARKLVDAPDTATDELLGRLHSDGWTYLIYHHPEFLDRCKNVQDLQLMIACQKQRMELLNALIGAPAAVTS